MGTLTSYAAGVGLEIGAVQFLGYGPLVKTLRRGGFQSGEGAAQRRGALAVAVVGFPEGGFRAYGLVKTGGSFMEAVDDLVEPGFIGLYSLFLRNHLAFQFKDIAPRLLYLQPGGARKFFPGQIQLACLGKRLAYRCRSPSPLEE